jgi:hypothetical protein
MWWDSHGAHGALDVQAPTPRARPNRAKRAQRPGEDIVGNRNFPLKGGVAALLIIFILQRVALPLSLPALFLPS